LHAQQIAAAAEACSNRSLQQHQFELSAAEAFSNSSFIL
jgi:hypothetical protein